MLLYAPQVLTQQNSTTKLPIKKHIANKNMAKSIVSQRFFTHFLRILHFSHDMFVRICIFVFAVCIFCSFAMSLDFARFDFSNAKSTKQSSLTSLKSTNKPTNKEPKSFHLESDSLVVAPDSRIKSIKPPAQNPASEILNPKKSLHNQNSANAELLDSSVIPQYLPRAKIPSPLMPPPALTPHTDISEPLEKREFIISYKALSQNGIITGEKYNISTPIISKSSLPIAYTCSIDTPINDLVTDDESYAIKYVLYFYKDLILDCLEKGGASVLSYTNSANLTHISDDTLLSVPARRVLAYFDNRYLILEILKELK
ncbi:hypothetical protein [Helicobacter sp. T3_23-1059]